MTDSDNLISKIARLATRDDVFEGDRRMLSGSGRDEILAAIIQEIDDTVLPRQLTFTAEPGRSVVLVAKGRRLQKICTVDPDDLMPEESDILLQSISGQEDDKLAALAGLMGNFADAAENLGVSVDEVEAGGETSAIGLSVQALQTVWLPGSRVAGGDCLGDWLASVGDDITAYILLENETLTSESGPDGRVSQLKELAASVVADVDEELSLLNPKRLGKQLLVVDRNADEFVCYGRIQENVALFFVDQEKLQSVLSNWHGPVKNTLTNPVI